MMKKFHASEKYRKYLIELQFDNLIVFTVWGTDVKDGEDKLLVNDEKVIAFKKTADIKFSLLKLENPYLDKENFKQWIDEENLNEVYNVNDLKLLSQFEFVFLKDKSKSLTLLNAINLIQDFAIQVNHMQFLSIFDQPAMVKLKDYIYNKYFWKGRDKNCLALEKEEKEIVALCKNLYVGFYNSISFVSIP